MEQDLLGSKVAFMLPPPHSLGVSAVGPLIEDLARSLTLYGVADPWTRERLLRGAADVLAGDPESTVFLLLSRSFSSQRETEGFLLTLAYALFLADRLVEAEALAAALAEQGCRQPFLVDILSRCLVERGKLKEALAVFRDNPQSESIMPTLSGRVAALLWLGGFEDEAADRVQRIKETIPPEIRRAARVGVETFDGLMALPPGERKQTLRRERDPYADKQAQARFWRSYETEFHSAKTRLINDSGYLGALLTRLVGEALRDDPTLDTVVNYGCLYAKVEAELAAEFPEVLFIGYDRAPTSRVLNERRFEAPNLVFADGDFAEAVGPRLEGRRALLCHMRTACFLFPEELATLYQTCADLGIAALLGVEGVSWSEADFRFPDFRRSNSPTILQGGNILMHDFPYFLEKAGYTPGPQAVTLMNDHGAIHQPKAMGTIIESRLSKLSP